MTSLGSSNASKISLRLFHDGYPRGKKERKNKGSPVNKRDLLLPFKSNREISERIRKKSRELVEEIYRRYVPISKVRTRGI